MKGHVIALLLAIILASIASLVFLSRPADAPAPPTGTPTVVPATPGSSSANRPPVAEVRIPTPPERDPYAIAERLRKGVTVPVARVIASSAQTKPIGHEETFWVTNLETEQHFQVKATLRYVSAHLYMYVQSSVDVPVEDVKKSADEFEARVYPCVQRYFGSEWTPGVDGDVHLTVFSGGVPGVAGYYSSSDQYPLAVNPFSNQREMFFLNSGAVRFGSANFVGTMAHEFQHMIHWNADRSEQTWINEGMSELSADVCGNGASFVRAFTGNPNIQLNAWASSPSSAGPYYGASYAFLKYLAGRYGIDTMRDLVSEKKAGIDGLDAWLSRRGGPNFLTVFKDWTIANILADPNDARFRYKDAQITVNPSETINSSGLKDGKVRQLGARYYEVTVPTGDATLKFQGDQTTRVLGIEPKSGKKFWWSNRADNMDSTLTREVDLSAVRNASLTFWAWYDQEKSWDYTYLGVSADGGKTWDLLPGRSTTSDNPVGNSYGPAWTGKSGQGVAEPTWIEERIDLSAYAGKKVLIRFESINDDAVNFPGFAIDDIAIPEINFKDDAESENGWKAEGYVLLGDEIPQRFQVQVIRYGDKNTVEDVALDANNAGEVTLRGFGRELKKAVIVVSGVTPSTTKETSFSLRTEVKP